MFMSPAPKHKLEIHSNRDMGVLGIEAGCPLGFCSANNYLIHVHHFTAIDCTSFSSILYSSIAFYALLFFSWFFYSVLFSVLFSRMLFCCILFFSILCDVVRISEISQLNFLWQRLKGTCVVGHTFVLFAPGTLWFLPAWRWEQSKLVWWVHLVYCLGGATVAALACSDVFTDTTNLSLGISNLVQRTLAFHPAPWPMSQIDQRSHHLKKCGWKLLSHQTRTTA